MRMPSKCAKGAAQRYRSALRARRLGAWNTSDRARHHLLLRRLPGQAARRMRRLRRLDADSAEIKRMFVARSARGKGAANACACLSREQSLELGIHRLCSRLAISSQRHTASTPETATRSSQLGYYAGVDTSICMEKRFNDQTDQAISSSMHTSWHGKCDDKINPMGTSKHAERVDRRWRVYHERRWGKSFCEFSWLILARSSAENLPSSVLNQSHASSNFS